MAKANKALYRKYRPKSLAEVVGQEQVTNTLQQALKQRKISHAYLFVGPRGTGKTSVARIFAHEINGFPYEIEDDYVDIIEIDGASNRGIDDIRELREKVTIAPSEGRFKVYIIDEVHMLTTPAFNALLKTLEEPPEHVVFLMATTEAHKVPRTILSRVQSFTFQLAEPEVMKEYLRQVAEAEKIQIDDAALKLVTQRGGGSFRDSLSLLDQISALSEGEITRDLVVAAMGLPEEESISQLLEAYSSGDLKTIAAGLREILSAGAKPELLAEGMIRKIIAEPKAEWLGLLARLPEVAAPFPEAKLLVAMTKDLQTNVTTRKVLGSEAQERKIANTPRVAEPMISKQSDKKGDNIEESPSEEITDPTFPFDWKVFKTQVSEQNDAIARQLEKVKFEIKGKVLNLYPSRKIIKNILEKPKNLQILESIAKGMRVKIHEVGEEIATPKTEEQKKIAAKLAKYSDIMGGEVVEDGGESPF